MVVVKVALPGVHMAGSDAHHNAHLEVGQHGLALFLAPDAAYPVLDVNGTSAQLEIVVRELQAALTSRRASNAEIERAMQMKPHRAAPSADSADRKYGIDDNLITHTFAVISATRYEREGGKRRRKAPSPLVHPFTKQFGGEIHACQTAARSRHRSVP